MRFSDRSREDTLVRLMTDGLLLAGIQRDPLLRRYDTVIVDEAHERSLNIDFLLGYLRPHPPAAARSEADHHLGDDRSRALRAALRRRARRRGVRPHVPGRGPLPAAGRAEDEDDADLDRDEIEGWATPSRSCCARRPATCSCSSAASARSATRPTR